MTTFHFLRPPRARGLCPWACFFAPLVLLISAGLIPSAHAQPADWAGPWETRWQGGGTTIEFTQNGNTVTGAYPLYDGRIEATADGLTLTGRWIQPEREGRFTFTQSRDGQSFIGRYDNGDWWNGSRDLAQHRQDPAVLTTPRDTLRSLLAAGNAVRAGDYQPLAAMVDCLDFSRIDADLARSPRNRYAAEFFDVIAQCTFRIWPLPGGEGLDDLAITLPQAGTAQTLTLDFVRDDQSNWRIIVPTREDMQRDLKRLAGARGFSQFDPQNYRQLRSPRDAMRVFLENIDRMAIDPAAADRVFATLNLSGLDASVRQLEAPLLADYLWQVLNRISFVVLQEIPNDPETTLPYVHFTHPRGEIVIGPGVDEEGRRVFRFTRDTLRSLRELYYAVESAPLAEGIVETGQRSRFFRVRDTMRSISPWLTQRTGSLDHWQWFGLGAVVLAGMMIAGLLTFFVVRLLRWRFRHGGQRLPRRLEFSIVWPSRIVIAAGVWYLGLVSLGLPEGMLQLLVVICLVAFVVAGAWTLYNLTDIVGSFFSKRAQQTKGYFDDILVSLVTGSIKLLIIIIGLLILAENLGIPYRSLLAGLGIGGLAIAIAARDTIANFFGSAVLLTDRPFRRGDLIEVNDYVGFVERVGIRSTRIRTLEDSLVVIPNSSLANEIIDNRGQRRARRIKTRLAVTYDTPPDKLEAMVRGIRETIAQQPHAKADWTMVGVWEFAASSIDLEFTAFLEASTLKEEYARRDQLMTDLVRLAHGLGVEFAFPTRTLYVQKDGDGPE